MPSINSWPRFVPPGKLLKKYRAWLWDRLRRVAVRSSQSRNVAEKTGSDFCPRLSALAFRRIDSEASLNKVLAL